MAHCQRSHPLFAAPQTEHGVKAGSPMHSSTEPTGSPSVELPAVVMTVSVGLAGIIGKVCQGHSSPKDDRRFMSIHPVVSQSSTTSWVLAFTSLCLSGGCYSHHEVAHDADPQRLKGYLYTPRWSPHSSITLHGAPEGLCTLLANHHGISQPSATSWELASPAWRLLGHVSHRVRWPTLLMSKGS